MSEIGEPLVVTAMRSFKARLLAREAAGMAQMAAAWLRVERALEAQIVALTLELAERKREGKTVSAAALYRLDRYKRLRAQTEEQFAQYGQWADGRITDEQATWAQWGLDDHAQSIGLTYQSGGQFGPHFDRLPVEAIEHLVGLAGDGRPVGDLLRRRLSFDPRLDASSAEVWARLTGSLLQGTAQGWNPRRTARRMQDDLTGGLNKALTIARSEQIRVYREAGREQWARSGVVSGQRRLTAHDDQVCAACIADEGTLYRIDEVIPDHAQGRCTGVPVVKGMPAVQWNAGEGWFRQQPETTQAAILGSGRLAAYQAGAFEFGALVTRERDPIWGARIVPTTLGRLAA